MEDHFKVHQMKTEGLAQYAYIIESEGEALIIDPLREIQQYLDFFESKKLKLKYIYLTHTHADFVAGHGPLAKRTGAPFLISHKTKYKGEFKPLKEGDTITVGNSHLKVLETPGHTVDSTCLVLLKNKIPYAVFTGDTSFIGEVGRPDLSVDPSVTQDMLAKELYTSIQKLIALPQETILYPGHGSGSSCGKNIGSGDSSTIGKELENNYAFKATSQEEFVKKVTENTPTAPEYFFHDVAMNMNHDTIPTKEIMAKVDRTYSFKDFLHLIREKDVKTIDCRSMADYNKGHLHNTYGFPLKGPFEYLVSIFIKPKDKIAVICKPDEKIQILTKLINIGYENIVGIHEGSVEEAKDQVEKVQTVTVADFEKDKLYNEGTVLDVRNINEDDKKVSGAVQFPASKINDLAPKLEKGKKYYVYCKAGGRAANCARILTEMGYDAAAIMPGFVDIVKTSIPIEQIKK